MFTSMLVLINCMVCLSCSCRLLPFHQFTMHLSASITWCISTARDSNPLLKHRNKLNLSNKSPTSDKPTPNTFGLSKRFLSAPNSRHKKVQSSLSAAETCTGMWATIDSSAMTPCPKYLLTCRQCPGQASKYPQRVQCGSWLWPKQAAFRCGRPAGSICFNQRVIGMHLDLWVRQVPQMCLVLQWFHNVLWIHSSWRIKVLPSNPDPYQKVKPASAGKMYLQILCQNCEDSVGSYAHFWNHVWEQEHEVQDLHVLLHPGACDHIFGTPPKLHSSLVPCQLPPPRRSP